MISPLKYIFDEFNFCNFNHYVIYFNFRYNFKSIFRVNNSEEIIEKLDNKLTTKSILANSSY